jgi:hypothetical protein
MLSPAAAAPSRPWSQRSFGIPKLPPAHEETQAFAPAAPPDDEVKECSVCSENAAGNSGMCIGDCTFWTCKLCFDGHIQALVNSGKSNHLTCVMRCHPITYQILNTMYKKQWLSKQTFDRINTIRSELALLAATRDQTGLSQDRPGKASIQCQYCAEMLLFDEGQPFVVCHSRSCKGLKLCSKGHGRMKTDVCQPCSEEAERIRASPEEANVNVLDMQGNKPCPNCRTPIFRDGGCRHMSIIFGQRPSRSRSEPARAFPSREPCLIPVSIRIGFVWIALVATCTQCQHEFFWCCSRSYRDKEQARAHLKDPECDKIQ